jgi:hypothetical protein
MNELDEDVFKFNRSIRYVEDDWLWNIDIIQFEYKGVVYKLEDLPNSGNVPSYEDYEYAELVEDANRIIRENDLVNKAKQKSD